MAQTDLARLVVTLEAQNAMYMKRLDQSEKRVARFEKRNKTMVSGVKKAMVGLGTLVSLRAFNTMLSNSIREMDKLAKTSDKLGILPEKLAGLRHAADLTGVATTTMDMAMQRYTRRVAEAAQGTGEARGALRELKLDADKLVKLPLEQQMAIVADRMGLVETQADRVRIAMKLFDSEGVALVNTLALGSEGLENAAKEAESLGIALDRDTLRQAEAANDALTRLKSSGKGLAMSFTGELAPAIEIVANWLQALTGQEGGLTTVLNLAKYLAEEVASLVHGPAIGDLVRLEEEMGKLDERLGNLKAGGESAYHGSFGPFDDYIARLESERDKLAQMIELTNQLGTAGPAFPEGGAGAGSGAPAAPGSVLLGAGDSGQSNADFLDNLYGVDRTGIADYYTELQKVNEETARLQALQDNQTWLEDFWAGGWQSYEQYLGSLQDAPEKTSKMFEEMSVFAEEGARNLQDSLSENLFSFFKGETTNLLDIWKDMLLQMAAQAASAKLFDSFGGFLKKKQGSGGFMGAVSAIGSFAGLFDKGGHIPSGQVGIAAESAGEFAHMPGGGFLLPGPADITSSEATGKLLGQGGGGPVQVTVINKAGVTVKPTVTENNGQTTVELLVETMRSAIANGQLDDTMASTYGMNRANGGRA